MRTAFSFGALLRRCAGLFGFAVDARFALGAPCSFLAFLSVLTLFLWYTFHSYWTAASVAVYFVQIHIQSRCQNCCSCAGSASAITWNVCSAQMEQLQKLRAYFMIARQYASSLISSCDQSELQPLHDFSKNLSCMCECCLPAGSSANALVAPSKDALNHTFSCLASLHSNTSRCMGLLQIAELCSMQAANCKMLNATAS